MSDTLLVAEVLSLQGNDVVGSSSLQCQIQTLDLVVSQLHLKRKKEKKAFHMSVSLYSNDVTQQETLPEN